MVRVGLVTGAGEGIGAAVAFRMARDGIAVGVNDLDQDRAQQVAGEIKAGGGQALALGGDISDVARLRDMFGQTVAAFGRLDIAVANAGVTSWGDFFDYPPEALERVLGVNLRGTYFTAQEAARHMRAHGEGGSIILMSSVTGRQAIRYLSAYSMTKAAIEMLARNLVVELSPHKIRINAVAPGATLTPRNLADDPRYAESWSGVNPLGKVAAADDIAAVVQFLYSDAATYITGETIAADGGWSAISPTPRLDFVDNKKPTDV
jgi:glucose 1-dehydrogenase